MAAQERGLPVRARSGGVRSRQGRRRSRLAEAADQGVGALFRIGRQLFAGLHVVQPLGHLVERGQAIADHHGADVGRGASHQREDVLGGVERPDHRVQLHDPGRALESVESAEGAVDPLAFVRTLFQGEQVGGGLFDQFAGLGQELFEELVHEAGSQSRPA